MNNELINTLNILFLCNQPAIGKDANTIVDHIGAFEQFSRHKILVYSNTGELSKKLSLRKFDVIIIHYSICLLYDYYLCRESKKLLREFQGLKVAFVQDEYRQINQMIDELAFLDIDVLFSCFPKDELDNIYSVSKLPNLSKFNNLTGYIPERLLQFEGQKPIKDRPNHIGYRSRKLPFWIGELAYEKWSIVDKWHQHTKDAGLKTDLSYDENQRIYGSQWLDFLASCKTTLGVESGASVMDFTGKLQEQIERHQLNYPNDTFHSVQQQYLKEHEGLHKLNQISPRCFEAIALKTVLVLYEGEYSGILVPNRHYIMLKKDFSNIEEVVAKIKDDGYLQDMAEVAYEEIALSGEFSYKKFIQDVDEILTNEFKCRAKKAVKGVYEKKQFEKDISYVSLKMRLYNTSMVFYRALPSNFRCCLKKVVKSHEIIRLVFRRALKLIRSKVLGNCH